MKDFPLELTVEYSINNNEIDDIVVSLEELQLVDIKHESGQYGFFIPQDVVYMACEDEEAARYVPDEKDCMDVYHEQLDEMDRI